MARNPWASRHSADCVGASARRILAAGLGGTILASHSRATYLLSGADDLLWLARCAGLAALRSRVRPAFARQTLVTTPWVWGASTGAALPTWLTAGAGPPAQGQLHGAIHAAIAAGCLLAVACT